MVIGKIFISHSTQDKKIADKVIGYLESQKFTCWVAPRDISPGMDWAESIIDGIDSASLMILIVSNRSNKSPQVRREVERAVSKGVTIIPVITEKIELSKWMQYYVSAHQWIDASSVPVKDVFHTLEDSIQAVFEKGIGEIERINELAGKLGKSTSINNVDTATISMKPLTSLEKSPSRIEQEQGESKTNKECSTKPDNKTNKRVHVSDVKSGLLGLISGTIIMLVARMYFTIKLIFFTNAYQIIAYSFGEKIEYIIFKIIPLYYYEIAIYAFLCGLIAIAIARTFRNENLRKLLLLGTLSSFLFIGTISIFWATMSSLYFLGRVAPYILLASCAAGLLISFINRLIEKIPGDSCND